MRFRSKFRNETRNLVSDRRAPTLVCSFFVVSFVSFVSFVCLFFGAGRWPVSVAAFRVARLFAAPVIHRRLRRLAGGRLAVVV